MAARLREIAWGLVLGLALLLFGLVTGQNPVAITALALVGATALALLLELRHRRRKVAKRRELGPGVWIEDDDKT